MKKGDFVPSDKDVRIVRSLSNKAVPTEDPLTVSAPRQQAEAECSDPSGDAERAPAQESGAAVGYGTWTLELDYLLA